MVDKCATWCLKNGISVIPIANGKQPAIKWGEYINKPLDRWRWPDCGVAMLTGAFNDVVVVDCDSEESAQSWLENRPWTPMRVKTSRGMHFYYRHPGRYVKSGSHIKAPEGFQYDIRADKAYVLMPPSKNYKYEEGWVWPKRLPFFQTSWRPTETSTAYSERREIRDVAAYISKMKAVEGQGGDKETYRVCCIVAESGLADGEAMAILADWNLSCCSPPWSNVELHRKYICAQERV